MLSAIIIRSLTSLPLLKVAPAYAFSVIIACDLTLPLESSDYSTSPVFDLSALLSRAIAAASPSAIFLTIVEAIYG